MFGRKSKAQQRQTQRVEAILRSFIDSLQDGDLIQVEYNFNEISTINVGGDDGYTPVTVGGHDHVGNVQIRGDSVRYGAAHWATWLKSGDTYYTTAITNIRIIERASVHA